MFVGIGVQVGVQFCQWGNVVGQQVGIYGEVGQYGDLFEGFVMLVFLLQCVVQYLGGGVDLVWNVELLY